MLQNVPDDHLNLILDAAAEKYKRMQAVPVAPMVKPQDANQDYMQTSDIAKPDEFTKDSIQLAPGRSDQQMEDQQKYMNDRNLEQLQNENAIPGQGVLRNPAATNRFSSGATDLATPQNITATPAPGGDLSSMKDIPIPQAAKAKSVTDAEATAQNKENATNLLNQAGVNEDMSHEYGRVEAEKQKTLAEGEQAAREQGASLEANRANQAQTWMNQAQEKADNMTSSFTKEANQMIRVDPMRVFNQGSTGNKIAFMISAAFGGLAQGGALTSIINNDIKAQEKDIDTHAAKANNYLSLIEKYVGSRQAATEIYSNAVHASVDQLIKAKEAGVKADPNVLASTVQENAMKMMEPMIKHKEIALKMMQEQEKLGLESRKIDTANAFEQTKINQNAAKLNIEKGTSIPAEAESYKYVANSARDIDKINTYRRLGINPSDAKFQAFAKYALSNGMTSQALASAISLGGIPDKDKGKYIDMARALNNTIRETAIDESGNRITGDKLENYMRSFGPKFIDNDESLDNLMKSSEDRLRVSASTLSGKTALKMYSDLPYTRKYLKKATSK